MIKSKMFKSNLANEVFILVEKLQENASYPKSENDRDIQRQVALFEEDLKKLLIRG